MESSTSLEHQEAGARFQQTAPAVTLPKGGGAIRGIGEKFSANPVTGTGSMTVPIATSPGRSGFGPQLALAYDSGACNGPFGFGWSLSLPSITRRTDKGLPRYLDAEDSDVFVLSGAEDLVPILVLDAKEDWVRSNPVQRTVDRKTYRIHRYRPRIEGLFARIERWTNISNAADVFWRSISKDNITTWYGKTGESRIADPADPSRIFSWLISQSHDDKGNVIVYGYKSEDSARIFEESPGHDIPKAHERHRMDETRNTQRYLKSIRYGNRSPYLPALKADTAWPEPAAARLNEDGSDAWMFEAVFDYGEHDANAPTPGDAGTWPARKDSFSSYRAGFEVRTYRTCQRVLMFHHFPGQADVERNCLVRSTDFIYSDEVNSADVRNPVYTFLRSVTQNGYRRNNSVYGSRSLPPVEFEYTEPIVQDTVEEVDPESLENLPIGLDGSMYRWTDLHGEGIPGIVTEKAGALHYKRNLSPIPDKRPDGSEEVKARFGPLETVAMKPNVTLSSGAEFMDLASVGQADVFVMDGPMPGLYKHDEAEGWQPFHPFTSRLTRDLRDPNLRFVDLDGDSHADVWITENDAFIWHVSLAEEGFGPARRVAKALDEEKGPRIVFADSTQSIYLADLSGDGLTDIVRIRNGEVCYWPNLGYGRFGAKVTMDDAPWFDNPDQFDHKRIRLADIDGSGTTDIIYLHREGVRLYFNQSGNSWSQPNLLKVFPRVDDIVSIVPTDLLGNGTACLVWSSPLPGDTRRPMRYVNLMGGRKPHLLVKTINNLGAETRVDYAPSTKFYLQDKRDGKPWITRLPFPVHVVERVETYDYISRNRFVSRYAYHHGYFDGEEREFRGFGMVEQWDTGQFAALADGKTPADNIDAASHVPPVHTKTWFHTGFYLGRERISRHFEDEYFREPGLTADTARPLLLDDTVIPTGLTPEEEREACRALKGSMLRQEVYADDAEHPGATPEQIQRARTPYTVTEQNFSIRVLQPRGANRHAVFFTHARETLTYHYERNPADPRVQHALTLKVDDYGNVLQQAAIGYGRRIRDTDLPTEEDRDKQALTHITCIENHVTNAVDDATHPDDYRTPLPAESTTYELRRWNQDKVDDRSRAQSFGFDAVCRYLSQSGDGEHDITYEDINFKAAEAVVTADPGQSDKYFRRPIERLRTRYRSNELDRLLAVRDLQSLALPGESYKLAFTPGLLDQVYRRPLGDEQSEDLVPVALRAEVLGGLSADQGGYVDLLNDQHWWQPSGLTYFHPDRVPAVDELAEARSHFFLPRRYENPFGHSSAVTFDDGNDLLMVETRDALGNCIRVDLYDYRVLQPRRVSDPNGNQTEVAFDALGMVVGTAVMGKPTDNPPQGDRLDSSFQPDAPQSLIDAFIERPREASTDNPNESIASQAAQDLLANATTRIVYDLDRFKRLGEPPFAATIAREAHVSALPTGERSKLQISFSYSDGFGREIQKKVQAEPGPLDIHDSNAPHVNPRWVGTGWTIFNNKGKPVRQYEPFFSATHGFEFGVVAGVSPVLFYDPADRVVATLHPNHTYEKVLFDPWQQTTWDVNDTCAPLNDQSGDPRTDPDIKGYLAEYFAAMRDDAETWQTWYQQRIDGALGQHEQRAAQRAGAHADTPTTAHFDALGRPFLTVARNRVDCPGHDLDGREDSFATRVELDIEGNQRAVRDAIVQAGDPYGRIVMQYAYDMLGNRIRQLSMEAGARWMLNDVAGKPIRAWDSRGHNFTTKYDALRRPVEQYVRGTFSDPDPLEPNSDPRTLGRDILVDKIEYGEPPLNATPAQEAEVQRLNLRTRIYRHADSAGIATNAGIDANGSPTEAYDFKGNLLRSTRQLVSDYTAIPDWQLNPQLDVETFEGCTRYDALNRPIQSIAPRSSENPDKFNVIQPVFNEANLLERVDVWLERATEPAGLLDRGTEAPSPVGVADIDYDAKGQRILIDYKTRDATVIRTTYAYDREAFRLRHLYTRRGVNPATAQGVSFTDDCENPNPPPATIAAPEHPPAGKGCGLQNLHYTYDPAGNITHIQDDAQQTVYFRNQRVDPSNDYTYDALYRLIQASGREHLGQNGAPIAHSYNDAGRVNILSVAPVGRFAANDKAAMGTYTERYVYDAVGNFLQMQHQRTDVQASGWIRRYEYAEDSLIEPGKRSNRLSTTTVGNTPAETYGHDAHGNMLQMPQLQEMQWDFKDQLRLTRRQRVNDDDNEGKRREGERTYYVYDASGQRVRKVTALATGALKDQRIYLGGFEIYRKHGGPACSETVELERETLLVMDDKQRIALVETRTLPLVPDPNDPRQLIRYQFGNHLGSASLEVDERAQIISYEEYAPYGCSTYQAVRSQTETAKRYRYTGKERDEENGLYYHGARYYAVWLGRWTSNDPGGLVDGPNAYCFVSCNPANAVDSSGFATTSASNFTPDAERYHLLSLEETTLRPPQVALPIPDQDDNAHELPRGALSTAFRNNPFSWEGIQALGIAFVREYSSNPSREYSIRERLNSVSRTLAVAMGFGPETSKWMAGYESVSTDAIPGEVKRTVASYLLGLGVGTAMRGLGSTLSKLGPFTNNGKMALAIKLMNQSPPPQFTVSGLILEGQAREMHGLPFFMLEENLPTIPPRVRGSSFYRLDAPIVPEKTVLGQTFPKAYVQAKDVLRLGERDIRQVVATLREAKLHGGVLELHVAPHTNIYPNFRDPGLRRLVRELRRGIERGDAQVLRYPGRN